MPLIERNPMVEKPQPVNIPRVQPEVYKTAVYEESVKPYKSMIAYVDGAPWTVDYYSQIVGKHSELKSIDTLASNSQQSYTKINNLELRVTSPLSDSYDSATATMKTSGVAHMYGNVVPNVDDHFITETTDRTLTIFKIVDVEVASTSNDTVYEISYTVIGNAQSIPDVYASLIGKTAKEYHFLKNRIADGTNPLVAPEEYKQLIDLNQAYRDILDYHMSVFYSKSNKMMILPGQANKIYDYSAVEFLFKLVDPTEHINLLGVLRAPNVPSVFADQTNIYDILITRQYGMLDQCNKEMAFVRSSVGGDNTYILGPYYYDIDYLVYPRNPDTTVEVAGVRPYDKTNNLLVATDRKGSSFLFPEDDVVSIPNGSVPLIYSAHKDGYYVFSEGFYNGTQEVSALEILVRSYLKNKTIDLNTLNKLISSYKSMKRMDQYYYGPILLLLIKESSRRTYS